MSELDKAIEVIKNDWLFTTDHVLGDNNKKLKEAINILINKKIKSNFLKVPDGIIRKDLIKEIKRYERRRYEGGIYYGIQIISERNYIYENLDKGGVWSDNQKEKRDELYENLIKELEG